MAISTTGLVVGALLSRDNPDPAQRTQLELVGGLVGGSPAGLVLLAALARQEATARAAALAAPAAPAAPAAALGPTDAGKPAPPPPPAKVQVPDVSGGSADAAISVLAGRGLPSTTLSVLSDEPQQTVLGTSPPAGSVVDAGTSVEVQVSAGLRVPNVVGKSLEEARQKLTAEDFVLKQKASDQGGPPDTVLKQDPPGDSFANAGSDVTVFVAKGKAQPDAGTAAS